MIRRFGIRHHGPGSARSLERAFEALRPDCVLIEGPADADEALPFAGDLGMRPPVALLVHAAPDPRAGASRGERSDLDAARAVFYPFAHFSPEWVALRWALANAVPVRFIDLPVALQLGLPDDEGTTRRHNDPLAELAAAAGYSDVDLFWERLVETSPESLDPFAIFAVIEQAMQAARSTASGPAMRERRREAHMRTKLREAEKAFFQRIAVVVGAWHAPELDLAQHSAKADAALLKGLVRTRTEVAWVPWTSARLAAESGYGAGVESPGWYAHLFAESGVRIADGGGHRSVATSWAVRAARLLRTADLGESGPASALAVVRTADALALLRELAAPGLAELREALLAVLCGGEAARLEIVRRELEIGAELGAVPPHAPATPLKRDVDASMRRLRLKAVPKPERFEWDLRRPLDRERVVFLHRLGILDIPFGRRVAGSGTVGAGTFKEIWELAWDPAFEVELALAARWGQDLAEAARALLVERARRATLPELARDLGRALDAQLPEAVAGVLAAMSERAAAASDVLQLGGALPGLARIIRYSDVRQTDRSRVEPVFAGLFARFVVGMPAAVALVDEAGAEAHARLLDEVTQALALLTGEGLPGAPLVLEWLALLQRLAHAATGSPHDGLVRGRAVRLLLDAKALSTNALERLTGLALSRSLPPPVAASWIAGLVAGSGVLLEHQERIWAALDAWLVGLDEEAFVLVLPLLRRAFAHFSAAERRRMGARLARSSGAPTTTAGLDPARVALLRPVLSLLYPKEGA